MRTLYRLLPVLLALTGLLLVARAVADDGITVLKMASVAPAGTPWSDGLDQLKKKVDTATAGKLAIRPFLGGVLGDENETVQSCVRGQIQGVGASTGAIASVVPELNVLELPMLFRNTAEADYILDKVVLTTLEAKFRERGLVLGFWSENGYRSFGTTFGFVASPTALKGHKMRSQESPVHIEMYRAFGASPVPIPVTEVLTSLQTGVIDGYDNSPLYAMAAQWTSATKYFTVSRHIYQPAAIIFNAAFFDKLPAAQQQLLLGARLDLALKMREEIRALDPLLIDNLRAMDIQVKELTAAERETFQGPAKVARDAYLAKASPGEKALYVKIDGALIAYRKTHP